MYIFHRQCKLIFISLPLEPFVKLDDLYLRSVNVRAMGVQDNVLTAKAKAEVNKGRCCSHFTLPQKCTAG